MAVSHEGEGDICSGLELDTEMLVPEQELLIEIELQREDNWPQWFLSSKSSVSSNWDPHTNVAANSKHLADQRIASWNTNDVHLEPKLILL